MQPEFRDGFLDHSSLASPCVRVENDRFFNGMRPSRDDDVCKAISVRFANSTLNALSRCGFAPRSAASAALRKACSLVSDPARACSADDRHGIVPIPPSAICARRIFRPFQSPLQPTPEQIRKKRDLFFSNRETWYFAAAKAR